MTTKVFAQTTSPVVQFGKVNQDELAMTTYPADPKAEAFVLYEKGVSYWYSDYKGMKLIHERHVRIKILSAAGASWTKVEIPIYKPKNSEQIEVLETLEGYTHLLKDGKIVRYALESQDMFLVKPTPDVQLTRFVMPYCEVGAVIEYRYKISSDYIFNLQGWDFQKSIPVRWSEYEVKIPEYFSYNQFVQGYEKYALDEKKTIQDYFGFSGRLETVDIYTNRWAMQDLPAFQPLPFMENPANVMPKMEFALESFKFSWMPSRQKVPADWKTIYTEIKKEDKTIDFFRKTNGLDQALLTILGTAENQSETAKLTAIFGYVQSQVKWNGEYSRLPNAKKAETIWQSKKGNSAEINGLLAALCRQAGLKSYAAVLASKETGKANPEYPIFNKLNHCIVTVIADSKTYLLDATSPYSSPTLLPLNCLNGKALVLAEDWYTVALVATPDHTKTLQATLTLTENGNLEGKATTEETGYIAYKSREIAATQTKEIALQRSLLLAGKGIGIANYTLQGDTLTDLPLQMEVTLQASKQAETTNNSLTIKPFAWLTETSNPFAEATRKYPVDFVFPFQESYQLTYLLPKGYSVKQIPVNTIFSTADNLLTYQFEILQDQNKLIVLHRLKVQTTKIEPANYADLRSFWDKIVSKHQEVIRLEKK